MDNPKRRRHKRLGVLHSVSDEKVQQEPISSPEPIRKIYIESFREIERGKYALGWRGSSI